MFESSNKSKTKGEEKGKPFIPKKAQKEVQDENLGLNKYLGSIPKPEKSEVHLLSYFHANKPISYQINQKSTTRIPKKEFDQKVAIKEVKGLVLHKTQLSMKESSMLYICRTELEEEEEIEKLNAPS